MITLDTLELPSELIWIDEFSWNQVNSFMKRTIQGKVVLSESNKQSQGGRLITLQSEDAWILRSDLIILREWTDVINKQMDLTLHDGTVFTTVFRLWETPCITATPIINTAYPDNDTNYKLTLKLMVL